MLALVPFAELYAQPAISDYPVGAVARGTTTGALYYGANMEFYGQSLIFTVHAEQSATTNAWLHGEQGLDLVAVSAAPCGYCRQFLYETANADKLQVLLTGEAPALLYPTLLPDAFGPEQLGVTSALMTLEDHGLSLIEPTDDPVILQALAAANASYAPYTSSFAGVSVQMSSGDIFPGRVAENAAYNPSMCPLEGAMTLQSLTGDGLSNVKRVVLVELESPKASQIAATEAVVETFAGVVLEIAGAR
jgi:cytidine deaminase